MSNILAESVNDLDRYLGKYNALFGGIDTETTKLDTRRAGLVGISVCLDERESIYCPIGHRLGTNLPKQPVIDRLKEKFEPDQSRIYPGIEAGMYNAKFDRNILQATTGWTPLNFIDLLELVYLDNPDRKEKDLKTVVKEDLNYDMSHFETLFTPEELTAGILDISGKHPTRVVDYACDDAKVLLPLYRKYEATRKEFDFAVKIDMKLIDIVRKVEHNGGMVLNREYVDQQIGDLDRRAEALREQIWRVVGHQFDIDSPKQLGEALFERMGISSPGMTKGKRPQHKTDAGTLDKLSSAYPVIELIISYKKVVKAKGTYFVKLARLDDVKLPIRFNFHMFAAPTFRFAAPGGNPLKDGFTGVNIQAVSNGELRDLMGVDLMVESEEDDYLKGLSEEDFLVEESKIVKITDAPPWEGKLGDLPYVVPFVTSDGQTRLSCFRETCIGCPAHCAGKGIDVTRRLVRNVRMVPSVRQAFMAPPGFSLVSYDYDRQELVIGANLSGEPRWIQALLNHEDLHILSSCAAFGISPEAFKKLPKEEQRMKRAIGKMLNFAIFYGATAYTIQNKANITRALAEMIYDSYRRGHPVLFQWIQAVQVFSRKYGYTNTFFGRRRWLKQFYDEAIRLEKANFRKEAFQMKAFADRSAVNTCIQGTGAEVTRIAMVRVDKMLRDNQIGRKSAWLAMQLHDELIYAIRDEEIPTIMPMIRDSMAFHVKSWKVQLSVGAKIGKVWGLQEEVDFAKVA